MTPCLFSCTRARARRYIHAPLLYPPTPSLALLFLVVVVVVSDRFVALQAGVLAAGHGSLPVYLSPDVATLRMGVVYSRDVGELLARVLTQPCSVSKHAWRADTNVSLFISECV